MQTTGPIQTFTENDENLETIAPFRTLDDLTEISTETRTEISTETPTEVWSEEPLESLELYPDIKDEPQVESSRGEVVDVIVIVSGNKFFWVP